MWQLYFTHMPQCLQWAIVLNFGMWGAIADVITHTKFFISWFRFWSSDLRKFLYLLRIGWSLLQQWKHCRVTLWKALATAVKTTERTEVHQSDQEVGRSTNKMAAARRRHLSDQWWISDSRRQESGVRKCHHAVNRERKCPNAFIEVFQSLRFLLACSIALAVLS